MKDPRMIVTGAYDYTIMETIKTLADWTSQKRMEKAIDEQFGADIARILSDTAVAVCHAWDAYAQRVRP